MATKVERIADQFRSEAVALRDKTRNSTELTRWRASKCPVFNLEKMGSYKEMEEYYSKYLEERRGSGHHLKAMDFEDRLLEKTPKERKAIRETMATEVCELWGLGGGFLPRS